MRFIGLWSIMLMLVACKKGRDDSQMPSSLPNKIGDTWVYQVQDTTWNNYQPTDISSYTMTVSVTGTKVLPGGISANLWVYTWPGQSATCYVTTAGDTIRFADIHEVGLHVFSRQYIIPIRLNNSWPYVDASVHNVQVDSQADILVGQMQFDSAFHISGWAGMPDGMFLIDEWYENNVGTVKRYYNAFGMALGIVHTISWSLLSYNLR